VGALRAANPEAQVWVWSDMLDPNHNAVDRYYLVEGDYSGSWKYVPPDLGIVCIMRAGRRAWRTSPGWVSAPWPAPITTATRSKIPAAGWPRSTTHPAPPASCTPPGKTSTSCWPTSATWSASRCPAERRANSPGIRTLAGACYHGDTLENPRSWLAALDNTPGAAGIMYTTWENKYQLPADFGDLVSQPLPR
jgi:hypothetical protein